MRGYQPYLALSTLLLFVLTPIARAWPPITPWPITRHQPATTAPDHALREVFPHVRVNVADRLVEFDAQVPIDAHAADGSVVFLEVIACRRDTKEHEALAMTDALPSHVHAALLLLDLQPGTPGRWEWQGRTLTPIAPQGPGVVVSLAWQDSSGTWTEHPALDLVVSRADGRTFIEHARDSGGPTDRAAQARGSGSHGSAVPPDNPSPGGATSGDANLRARAIVANTANPDATGDVGPFAFAGSRFVDSGGREFYDADGAGIIVGLHTFGSEVVALRRVMSPEASVLEPEWIARADLLPERGTPVVVRIRAIDPPAP